MCVSLIRTSLDSHIDSNFEHFGLLFEQESAGFPYKCPAIQLNWTSSNCLELKLVRPTLANESQA